MSPQMTTCSGANYNSMGDNPNINGVPDNGGHATNTSSLLSLEDKMVEMMREMCTHFDTMENRFYELRIDTNRRLNTLETTEPLTREHRPPLVDRGPNEQQGRNQFWPPPREYGQRREIDQEERILRNVKIEAPSFEGQLDPTRFLDWL